MILYLCFLCLLCFFNSATATTSELCFDSTCNDSFQTVRFPFRIRNQQPKSCGYPGFDLTCHSTGQPLLHLPSSGDFSVQFIDFFNCSWNDQIPYGFNLNPISCLSELSYAVFASSSSFVNGVLSTSCDVMKTVSVPESFPPDLRNDLRLEWKNPNCRACESRGGVCDLKFNSSNEVECNYNTQPQPGMSRGARYAVSIGVGVPATMCFLGFLCCLCARVRSNSRGRNSSIEAHWVMSSRPIPMGLDGPTIDSYPKVVLGQSLRLPKPNDNICPICLSEYRPKETVKSIPECQHFFHQDCIDEWLRLNASCPVCRKAPIKSTPFDFL